MKSRSEIRTPREALPTSVSASSKLLVMEELGPGLTLTRYRAALDAGTDPVVVAGWIKQVTADEIRAELDRLGGLLPLLQVSDPKLKARFCEEVGLSGTYDPRTRVVDVEVRVLNDRVGGGT